MRTKNDYEIKTEEDYREALQRFLEIVKKEDCNYNCIELFDLMKKLEEYEKEHCM